MSRNRPPVQLAVALICVFCAGCSVSLRVGDNKTTPEQHYRNVLVQPFGDLTVASTAANAVCAGGSSPDPRQCYLNTNAEIGSARAVLRALHSVAVPPGYAKANADLAYGLTVFIAGLTERNRGLATHSDAQYTAGENLVIKALELQKRALSEYPPGANITG